MEHTRGSKTDRDRVGEENMGRYCLKTFETAKGKKIVAISKVFRQ